MKKILIALALASVSAPVLAQQLPAAVIVTVDRQEMIATSAAAKAAQTELKPKADALNARLSQLRTSLAAEEKTLRDTQPAQAAAPAAIQAWQAKVRDFDTRRGQADQELQRRQQEIQASEQWVVKQINDGAQPIISLIMRERGANIAVDEQVTIQHAAAIDITAIAIMKKLLILGLLLSTALFQSCSINENPQPITNELLAEVFEVKAEFTSGNSFRNYYNLNPVIFDSDVLLVYEFVGLDKTGADIWKPLPQIYTSENGIHQYNFDFTKVDFSIFLDANFDRMRLNNSWRLGKVFRVVIVPGKFAKMIDKNNLQNVMNTLKLTESSVVDLSK